METETEDEARTRLKTHVDLDLEKAGVKAFYAEQISADRDLRPMLLLYRAKDRVLGITCRPFHGVDDENKSLMEMMYLLPATNADTGLICLPRPVQLENGHLTNALFMIATTNVGAFTEVMPYFVEDNGEIMWSDDEVDSQKNLTPFILHMFPVFAQAKESMFITSDLVQYLGNKGHEIELYGEWTYENLDTKSLKFMP